MSARDVFEEAREASFELYRHDLRYNAMERRAMSLGGSTEAHVSSGSIRDRMAAADDLVDYEAMMGRYEAQWCAAIDRAMALLYGADWQGGIFKALSPSHAEVLDCIYIQRLSLPATAARVRWSERKCHDLRREAFAYIDMNGLA